MKFRLLFFCGFVFIVSACKTHKLKKNTVVLGNQNSEVLVEKKDSSVIETKPVEILPKVVFETQQTDFEKIKIRSKISLKTAKIDQNIPATIHMKKDSVIWISVSLGLEAARASINPDSIFLLDRLNKKYYKISFNEISEKFDFDLNFKMLQSLLVGNLPVSVDSSDVFVKNTDYNSILQKRDGVDIVNKFDVLKNKLISILAKDSLSNTELNIDYKSFVSEGNKLVPTIILLLISGKDGQKSSIEFEHSKFDFLDRNIRFPFNIPKGYDLEKIPNF